MTALVVASLMVSSASIALSLWSLKVSRDADFNASALELEQQRLRQLLSQQEADRV